MLRAVVRSHALVRSGLLIPFLMSSIAGCAGSASPGGGPRPPNTPPGSGAIPPAQPDLPIVILPDAIKTLEPFDLLPPVDLPANVVASRTKVCQYLQAGPVAAVAGLADFNIMPPPITSGATAYRVSLPHGRGHVGFTPTASGEYAFYTTLNIPVAVFSQDGTVINLKSQAFSVQECTQVKGINTFMLVGNSTFIVRFGTGGAIMGTIPASVDVVVSPVL